MVLNIMLFNKMSRGIINLSSIKLRGMTLSKMTLKRMDILKDIQ
jgi:hypothetical protein